MRVVVVCLLIAACQSSAPPAIDAPPPPPPIPAGCITDTSAGDHAFTCGDLAVDVRIPPACEAPGCGLVLELHGDTGTGLLMDAHLDLRARAAERGYIVIAPTGPPFGIAPGSTWHADDDAKLVDLVTQVRDVFRVDAKRIHVTGFSRGGFVTWRLLCDHADLFASAAPGGAGDGSAFNEGSCFESPAHQPSRHIPIAFLVGRTDAAVGFASMQQIHDAAIAAYGGDPETTLASDATYAHRRAGVFETWEHGYETVADGPWASAKGHCIPGSTTDPYAPQYAIPCVLPNAFTWGAVVMDFFVATPMP